MDNHLKKNTLFIKGVFFFLTASLILQLFRLQVVEHKRWLTRSEIRNELRKTYQASRGSVYFADGSPLAVSELAYGIFALPDGFDNGKVKDVGVTREKFAEDMSTLLKIDKQSLLDRISNPKLKYVAVANKVSVDTLEEINELYDKSMNIWTYEEQTKRVYPDKTLASKIIGFVGKDEDGNDVGRYGIEAYFDGVLKGSEGIFEGIRDSKNQIIVNEEFDNVTSKNGIDLTLTIDRGIQSMLEERLWYYMDRYKAKGATGVIMEPNTGKIFAIADLPTYDPNEYWIGEKVICDPEFDYYILNEQCNKKTEPTPTPTPTDDEDSKELYFPEGYEEQRLKEIEEEKKKLEEEEQKVREQSSKTKEELEEEERQKIINDPRIAKYPVFAREIFRTKQLNPSEVYRNAANSYLYEPGSVQKVITLAIAYQYKTVPTSPSYRLGSHTGCEKVIDATLCTSGKVPRTNLTVEEMLEKSDNVGALRVAKTVDIKTYVETLQRFGLGRTTGVELADEPAYNMKDPTQWTRVDQATASYGQGSLSMTPIQMCHAWNILASGGKSYKPTVVKEINDNGKRKEFEPEFVEQVITEQAARDALQVNAVATSKSIRSAQELYAQYPFSGKTGTADIPNPNGVGYLSKVVNTSYVGIAPLDNPRFTMLIWFREPRMSIDSVSPNGANTAQYAWVDIASRLMVKMNIAPRQ